MLPKKEFANFGKPLPVDLLVFESLKMKKSLIALGSLVGSAVAFAQASPTTTAFSSAVTSVGGDIATFGGALIGVAAIGVGFAVGMKYVKKIRGAA